MNAVPAAWKLGMFLQYLLFDNTGCLKKPLSFLYILYLFTDVFIYNMARNCVTEHE